MADLADYELREKIHESKRTIVYRGRRRSDDRAVIVKTSRSERPPPSAIARLRHEYGMGTMCSGSGVIEYLAVEPHGYGVAVVTEDCDGGDLRSRMDSLRGDHHAFLALATSLAEALSCVHEQGVVHRDVKPANVVVGRRTAEVKLIDFGLASEIVRERFEPTGPAGLEGTLSYMSPEQTGRMNRTIDHRSDLYSLGVTFYEILCGRLPFVSSDPLELIHSHLAKLPIPPHQLDSGIPRVLSELVTKLLAKNAEDRYRTARGLGADLRRLQQQLRATGRLEGIELGGHDRAQTIQLSQRLYGRGPALTRLLAAFERVGAGSRELILVRGPAGIGKTSLVAEVHRPMTRTRGYFIRGKCDPLQRHAPYTALLGAFGLLLREVLTQSEDRLARWRNRLVKALGPNAQLMVEVLPDLRLIIGDPPPPTLVGPAEAQRRFDRTFLRLVGVFAGADHPLVVVLDDLQWVDSATLRLVSQMLTHSDCTHLLVVGAYRGEEVDAGHPLTAAMAAMRAAGARVDELGLSMLEVDDVIALVADTLGCTAHKARPLATLVHGKTGGNPFFIGELLRSLHAEGLLCCLDEEGWVWDPTAIEARGVSTSVVDLLIGKVRLLSGQTQQILRIAACLGNTFSLGLLCPVLEQPLEAVAQGLREAVRAGLVQPLGDLYQQAELGMAGGEAARYRFTHDRIQEAAYSLLPEQERPAAHWRVGELLLERTPPEQREAHIFEIVNQLDHRVALGKPPAERVELARLDLLAGQRAAGAVAHDQALVYLRRGIELLGPDGFETQPALALELHVAGCSSAQLSGDLAGMDRFAAAVLASDPSPLDRVRVEEIKIRSYSAQGLLPEALALGLEVLASFDLHLPPDPGLPEFQEQVGALVEALGKREVEALAELPPMNDPVMRAMMRVLVAISPPAYSTKPMLYPAIIRMVVDLTLEHGTAPESAFGYSQYGMLCCSTIADYAAGQRFARLALTIVDRLDAQWMMPRMELMVGIIRAWAGPLVDTCEALRDGYRQGMDNGDPEWAGHCIQVYGLHALFGGCPLEPLLEEMTACVEALARAGQQSSVTWINTYRQLMLNLMGRAEEPTRLRGEAYDEQVMIPLHQAHTDLISLLHLHLDTLILSYLFGDHARALEYAERTEEFLPVAAGQICVPIYNFYDSLARLAVAAQAPPERREELLARVEANQGQLEVWAGSAPTNHRHKWLLVEAERHRLAERLTEAVEAYDQAIAQATEHGFPHEAAIANERAAELWRARSKPDIALVYARAARYDYERWGAEAKIAHLEERYPELRPAEVPSSLSVSLGEVVVGEGDPLDMGSVFKATRVISEEMDLQEVITKLMMLVIENAGARRGFLLLHEEGSLRIQASGSVAEDAVVVERPTATEPGVAGPDQGTQLCEAIVRYVSRTREPVVLHDALHEGMFTRDPHVQRSRARSILCMPFSTPTMSEREAVGVLYLENADVVGAFTHDRVRVLKLITAQAAISIENARLYGDLKKINAGLEQMVEERTRGLREAQQALVRASRKAGQAEVAENLLHNAGNALNRLTVTMGLLRGVIELPAVNVLHQAVARLADHDHDLSEVLAGHERGPLLLKLLGSISEQLDSGKQKLRELTETMGEVVDEFVRVFQQHDQTLGAVVVLESFLLETLLDEAIASAGAGQWPGFVVARDYGWRSSVRSDRYGLERLVVGLLHELRERAGEAPGAVTTLTVASTAYDGRARIIVGLGDRFEGRESHVELFRQQRVSHPDSPTLHDCANAAHKLGAVLEAFVGSSLHEAHFVLTLEADTNQTEPEPEPVLRA